MDIERERGITIKAQTVRLNWQAADGETYELNLMDTPGHVDFAYEVSRSLAACEGALLVVDAAQGVEAQTLANVYQSIEHDHEIVPVINKVDLPAADPERVTQEIEDIIGLDASPTRCSPRAKTGIGIDEVLQAIVDTIPPPKGDAAAPLKAMLVDSWYDPYLGVVILVRVIDGAIRKGAAGPVHGRRHHPSGRPRRLLPPQDRATRTSSAPAKSASSPRRSRKSPRPASATPSPTPSAPRPQALPGFKLVQPVVFCGLFPTDAAEFEKLRDSLYKLRLNDASFSFEMETSAAFGFGFRCGFLGLLHLEIIQERLTREYDLDLITTAPSRGLPDPPEREEGQPFDSSGRTDVGASGEAARRPRDRAAQPRRHARPQPHRDHRGAVDRGDHLRPRRISGQRAQALPGPPRHPEEPDLRRPRRRAPARWSPTSCRSNEVVFDFYDRLKSISRGYASFDYHQIGHRDGDLVKMSILVNGEPVDALSMIVHRGNAEARGRGMCERLKELIPRHLFKIPIQAAIGGKVIARETIAALRKDVTAKCYGGDATRKRKLLEKQKEGKKRRCGSMGSVSIPQEAFIAALRMGDDA